MLTCISRSKKPEEKPLDEPSAEAANDAPSLLPKSATSQLRDMAVKASGSYLQCAPCTGPVNDNNAQADTGGDSDRFKWPSLRRNGSSNSSSQRIGWGKELEARLKGISSSTGEVPFVGSSRRMEVPIVYVEETLPKEWVAQAEPGVLITFMSLPEGGNDLKRISFSREKFNKWRAQTWWAENYDRIMELYNVRRLNRQTFPLPTTAAEDERNSKTEFPLNSPTTHERVTRQPPMVYSSPDSEQPARSNNDSESTVFTSTPNISSISGTKTASTSCDSITSSSSRDAEDLPVGQGGAYDNEWVQEDEPGVYITIRALPGGKRELRRVRFSREMFGELHARVWWEENRVRVHQRYL